MNNDKYKHSIIIDIMKGKRDGLCVKSTTIINYDCVCV